MVIPDRFQRTVPWRLPDLYLVGALSAAGVVLVVTARVGIADRSTLSDQIPWLNVGVGGVIVLAAGNVLWVLAGMRAVGELRRLVVGQVRAGVVSAAGDAHQTAGPEGFVTAPNMTRYHRPDCLLVAGKRVEPLAHGADDLGPCGVCVG